MPSLEPLAKLALMRKEVRGCPKYMCPSRGFKRGRNQLSMLCLSPMWDKADRFCLWFCGLPWIHRWHLMKLVQLFRAERRESWELAHNWTVCIFFSSTKLWSLDQNGLRASAVTESAWRRYEALNCIQNAFYVYVGHTSFRRWCCLLVCIAREGICLEQSDWLWKPYSWAIKCIFSLGVKILIMKSKENNNKKAKKECIM